MPGRPGQVGALVWGSVRRIESFGLFLGLDNLRVSGLLHISNMSRAHVEDPSARPRAPLPSCARRVGSQGAAGAWVDAAGGPGRDYHGGTAAHDGVCVRVCAALLLQHRAGLAVCGCRGAGGEGWL